ncbi:MAG TPA: MaoC/PaaZ C-terminal domain-containing protein [Chloroflexia bacterium]|nr:MaoC/PaaZ C-terminal domain-containing protein [Chloroflexia bacterium]
MKPNTVFRYFDELELGDRMVTRARTITESDLVNFAALTWDSYALHTDTVYASETMFGERIAHGMLVLSYTIGLFNLQPGPLQAFYGIDNLRFTHPVKIGDTIHAELEIRELQGRDDRCGVSTNSLQVLNQKGEMVIAGRLKMLLARRPE